MKLNDHFKKFVGNISLNPSRTDRIESALSNWKSKFKNHDDTKDIFVDLFSQGSYSTDTTVKPKEEEEYDIDAILLLDVNEKDIPKEVLKKIASVIRSYKDFEDKVTIKDRCVRINYAGDFHVDIVPAFRYLDYIKIPSKKENEWTTTNPEGFTSWCNDIKKYTDGHFSKVAKIIKHWRDLKVGSDTAPKSILLTTIVGNNFVKNPSIAESLIETVSEMISDLEKQIEKGDVFIKNPSLATENLARDWDSDKCKIFLKKLTSMYHSSKDALEETDKDKSVEKWQDVFEKPYFPSDLGEAKDMADKINSNSISVNAHGVLTKNNGIKIKNHRFYGRNR